MDTHFNVEIKPTAPVLYQIRVQGQLSAEWSDWFGGLTVSHDDGNTLLTGPLDQAALYGVLKQVRDLGLVLLTVNCMQVVAKPCPGPH